MRRTTLLTCVLLLSLLLFLPGCYFAAGLGQAPWKKKPQPIEPAVQANWSEPVNGVRMAVTQIASNTPDDHVLLLVMAQNVTGQPIDWPGIQAEPVVQLTGPDHQENAQFSGSHNNLRILVNKVGRQLRPRPERQALLDSIAERHRMLEPGEIRLHALRLEDLRQFQRKRLQQRDVINTESVLWPGLTSHDSEGRWQIKLIYRPEGFPSPPNDGRLIERTQLELDERWRGVEIELPALEIDWVPIPGPNDL